MSGKNRQRYLTATVLNQEFLDWCHDNLECRLEMICEIETPTGTIYASDRNKYVGDKFYEALLVFPNIGRTVGEWLAPEIQFSSLTVELSNADERFNDILPGGANFDSWVGKTVVVKIGLAEVASTYKTIFKGKITPVGGVKRSVKSITIVARDDYDRLSVNFPTQAFTKDTYADLEDALVGTLLPVIYGDFTTSLGTEPAIVPTYVTNGVYALANPTQNLDLRISENVLSYFDSAAVYLKRSDIYTVVPGTEIVNIGVDNNQFEVKQGATAWVPNPDYPQDPPVPQYLSYVYENGDVFYVKVKGKDLGTYDDNIVWQVRDILMTYGGLISGDFDSNWVTYRDKASPVQSAIANIKSRVWLQESTPVIQYALSMLEQVRLEAFISRDQLVKINSLHFEDFDSTPNFTIRNWDVAKDSFRPQIDDRNNFNRAQGAYDFHPDRNENTFTTSIYKNQDSINQIQNTVSKRIVFPNLYLQSDAEYQLVEILRMASAIIEVVELKATWRSILLDIGDFTNISVNIGSSQFDSVPAMIRDIGYDPNGMTVNLKLWSTMMLPFPGYTPGFTGTVGGYNATITKEV